MKTTTFLAALAVVLLGNDNYAHAGQTIDNMRYSGVGAAVVVALCLIFLVPAIRNRD